MYGMQLENIKDSLYYQKLRNNFDDMKEKLENNYLMGGPVAIQGISFRDTVS